jgi:SAM-dependent methyltransferase
MNNKSVYKCVFCGNNDLYTKDDAFLCNECITRYQVIDDIPIFVPNSEAAISAYVANLGSEKQRLQNIKNIAENAITKKKQPSEIKRIQQIISGTTWNIQLLNQQSISIANHLKDQGTNVDFLSWASVQTGLSFHGMLIYFYQDWFGIEEFRKVEKFFCEAVEKYSADRDSVAVLGAAACGLLHSMSHYFDDSYGVDLVLPALLAAKRFISGNPLTFHLEKAQWKKVQLTPPSNSSNNVHFITANVMNLPFKDNSLSVIATQFLLNVVGDPIRFSEEIHRVLKDDGIWINFSQATNINDDQPELGLRSLDEFIGLLQDTFKPILADKMRFKFLNIEAIDPSATIEDSEVRSFVLKKTDRLKGKLSYNQNKKLLLRSPEALWSKIPRIVARKQPTLSHRKIFSPNGISESSTLSIIGHSFDIPREFAQWMERILVHIDGQKTVLDIYENLHSERDFLVASDFLRLMHCLSFDHYLIDFY